MNLRVLKKSRRKPEVGDIFALQARAGEYLFGRVVSVDARIGGFDNVVLVYVYNARSTTKASVPMLDKRNLLVPPIGTNRQPWLRGYFETIATQPLRAKDVLAKHCFGPSFAGKYYDEQGRELQARTEPCGEYGVESYRTIDDAISDAVGIPRAED